MNLKPFVMESELFKETCLPLNWPLLVWNLKYILLGLMSFFRTIEISVSDVERSFAKSIPGL